MSPKKKTIVITNEEFEARKKEILQSLKDVKKREKKLFKNVTKEQFSELKAKKNDLTAEEKSFKKEFWAIIGAYQKVSKEGTNLAAVALKNKIVDLKFLNPISDSLMHCALDLLK